MKTTLRSIILLPWQSFIGKSTTISRRRKLISQLLWNLATLEVSLWRHTISINMDLPCTLCSRRLMILMMLLIWGCQNTWRRIRRAGKLSLLLGDICKDPDFRWGCCWLMQLLLNSWKVWRSWGRLSRWCRGRYDWLCFGSTLWLDLCLSLSLDRSDYLRNLGLDLSDLWRILIWSLCRGTHICLACLRSLLTNFLGTTLSNFFISLFSNRWVIHLSLILIFSICPSRWCLDLILSGCTALMPLAIMRGWPLLPFVLDHISI